MVKRCEMCKRLCEIGDQKVSFHRFPRDEKLLEIWKKIIGLENISKEALICSRHFKSSDLKFAPGGIRRFLRKGAVPIIHDREEMSRFNITYNYRLPLSFSCNGFFYKYVYLYAKHFYLFHPYFLARKKRDSCSVSTRITGHLSSSADTSSETKQDISLTKKRHNSWLRALGRDPNAEQLSQKNVICSRHFSQEDLCKKGNRIHLKPNAVPTLYLRKSGDILAQGSSRVLQEIHKESPQKINVEMDDMEVFLFNKESAPGLTISCTPIVKIASSSSMKVPKLEPISDASSVDHCFRDKDSSITTAVECSPTSIDSNSIHKNIVKNLETVSKMSNSSSVAVAAPKFVSRSDNFQDMFQRKVRHEILTDIARERMQLQGSTDSKLSTRALRHNSSKQNETELQKCSAKPPAESGSSFKSITKNATRPVFIQPKLTQPELAQPRNSSVLSPQNTSKTPVILRNSSKTSVIPQNSSKTSVILQNASKTSVIPQNASNYPVIPQNSSKTSVILQNASKTSVIPQNASKTSVIPQNASKTSVIPQRAPQTLVHLPQTLPNTNTPVNSIIIMPQTSGATPNRLFLLPQNVQQNFVMPPLTLLSSLQQTNQISVDGSNTLQVSEHPRLSNSFTNTTAGKARHVDSSIACQLSNSSTDSASETSHFIDILTSNTMEESFSKSTTKEKQSRCRTCLDPVPNQVEQAPISMNCFEEKTVKEGLVQLLPEMNTTLSDDQFVCAKCFMLLRNTLKFMKKCLEAESVIAENLKINTETVVGNEFIEDGHDLVEIDDHENISLDEDTIDDDVEEENDSAFELDPNVDEQDYVLNGITNLINGSTGMKSKDNNSEQSDLKNAEIKHLNFLPLQHAEVLNHNSIVSIGNMEPDFIFSLQQNKIRLLQNCSKFDENIFTNKRVLLLGGHTEIKCLLCEEHFNTEAKMQNHISDVHGLSKAFLMETYCYQYKPGSSNICEACGKDCGTGLNKKAHLKSCYVFPCPYCDELFTSGQLPNHTSVEHNDPKPFKCVRCKKEKVNFVKFKTHLCNSLICEVCGKHFQDKNRFRFHTEMCINSEKGIRKCRECKQSFDASVFSSHIKTHTFPCPICGKLCANRRALCQHKYNHRLKSRELCPLCGKDVLCLRQHMRVHDDTRIKRAKCSQCSRSFFEEASLVKHIRIYHSVISIMCAKCGILCKEDDIKNHYEKQHPHETVFNCAQCEATFTRITFLKQHSKSHAVEDEGEMDKKSKKRTKSKPLRNDVGFMRKYKIRIKAPETPITCKYCLKTLKGLLHYRVHLETHLTLCRYKCRYCEMTYSSRTNKYRHERLHKDPNYKFRCGECWKIMSCQEELDSHMVRHANKPKRYQCGECSEQFCREYQLRTHLVNKHTRQGEIDEARDKLIKDAFMDFAIN